MTQSAWADSPSWQDRYAPCGLSGEASESGGTSAGIPGAIARAVRRSYTDRNGRLASLHVGDRLRADRARAIVQRDRARSEAQQLRSQLDQAREELAAAVARARQSDSARGQVVLELRDARARADGLANALNERQR